jgi:HTH-like domain
VSYIEAEYQMSERHACRRLGLGRSTHRYRARTGERDAVLRTRLKELAAPRMRFGYRRLTAMLVREGTPANHKRVYRLYREEGLGMRIRQRVTKWNLSNARARLDRTNLIGGTKVIPYAVLAFQRREPSGNLGHSPHSRSSQESVWTDDMSAIFKDSHVIGLWTRMRFG